MPSILAEIIVQKEAEVKSLLKREDLSGVEPRSSHKSFKESLLQEGLSVIAEIKRKSPSKGVLSNIVSPLNLTQQYLEGGTSAISVLTDQKYFSGSVDDLVSVSNTVKDVPVTILRKDFIIHPIQIDESILMGADAVLLIVAALQAKLPKMLEYAKSKNMDALVEVHDYYELNMALDAGAEIIGVNNRDLKTFKVDVNQSLKLVKQIPNDIIKVSESGITSPEIARQLYENGFQAVLVGEALVRSDHPANFIRQMRGMK